VLTLRSIETAEEFRALREDWDALVQQNPATTIFQTWEWLYSWWEAYGSAHRLRILVASDESGRILAIAPLMIRWSRVGFWPMRTLEFIGGHSAASEYLDFVTLPGMETVAASRFMTHLVEEGGWDLLRFYQLAGDGTTRQLVCESKDSDLHLSPIDMQPSLYIALRTSWESYVEGLRPHARKNLRQYRRRIEAAGTFEVVEERDYSEASLAEFERLHKARMRLAGRVTNFESPAFGTFHRLVAERCAKRGTLRVYFLRHEGKNVATLYGFALHGRFFFYNSGFDPEYGSQNVGTALLSYAIERCIDAGMTEFDFLGPGDYKERWGVEERQKLTFAVSRNARTARLYASARQGLVRQWIKQATPTALYRFVNTQRRQLLVRFNRPLR
jgi:CelD/BcsL family acetyltransferase involved in cellulose biosynthesis